MAICFWKKNYWVRSYTVGYSGGYQTVTPTDAQKKLDIQTMSDTQRTDADGDISTQRIKAFGDFAFQTSGNGVRGDRVWFQNKWFECTASRLSDNTIIRHYVSEFVECPNQDPTPVPSEGDNG